MVNKKSLETVLEGVLEMFIEMGCGWCWVFQDKRFMSYKKPDFGVDSNREVFDSNNPKRKGKTKDPVEVFLNNKWFPFPDPIFDDKDYAISSLHIGEKKGNIEADKRLMKKYGFKIKYFKDRMDEKYGSNWHFENIHTVVTPNGKQYVEDDNPMIYSSRPYSIPKNGLTRSIVEWEDGIREKRSSNTLFVPYWLYEGLHILQDGDKLTIYHPDDNKEIWSGVVNVSKGWDFVDKIGIKRKVWAKYFFDHYPAKLISGGLLIP